MTDEEMSELAECLQDSCDAAVRDGVHPEPSGDCCPFGALVFWYDPLGHHPMPFVVAQRAPGVDEEAARDFMRGFDGKIHDGDRDERAFNLGRLFREQYK